MSVSQARRTLHALIREFRKEGAEVTLTARGEPVATLTVMREPRRSDLEAFRRSMVEACGSQEAWEREARAFRQFMELVVASRGIPNWLERLEDPSDPELT